MLNTIFSGLFETTTVETINIKNFLLCLFSALILGAIIALTYRYKSNHTDSFVFTLAIIPAVVAVVILLVNGSLGTGVAVAGAFSLVRFRSAPGTAKEICAIFLDMATGLACGMGYIGYAVVFTLVLCVIMLVYTISTAKNSKATKTLRIVIPENLDYDAIFDDVWNEFTASHRLSNVKTTNMGSLYKVTYDIILKPDKSEKKMIDMIRCRNGNLEISCSNAETPQNLL